MKRYLPLVFLLLVSLSTGLHAQQGIIEGAAEPAGPSIISKMALLAGIAVLPFVIMLLTSYMKIVIVLGLLRNAIGVQQSPPAQVLNGIALLMTIYVMYPTGVAMYKSADTYISEQAPKNFFSPTSAHYLITLIDKTKEPMREFLAKNTITSHQHSFLKLAKRSFKGEEMEEMKKDDFIVLIPSYITSQLKAAFEIGVLVYLPFFVIDLVTSNILLAMGMMMLSPLTIALPLKLLLLVMVDGWTVIIQGLVHTFK